MLSQFRRAGSRAVVTLVLAAVAVYFLIPLWWIVVSSTKTVGKLFTSAGLWFAAPDAFVGNVRRLVDFQHGIFLRWMANSVAYSAISAGGATILATLAGYAFAKYNFRGRSALFFGLLGTIMVPSTALVIPTFLLMSVVGLINSPVAVILPSLFNPFGVYLVRVYATASVPDELIEAARVDGAGEMRTLWSIVRPILAPVVVTVMLFSFVATWNNFFLPLVMLSSTSLLTVPLGLYQLLSITPSGKGGGALFTVAIVGVLVTLVPMVALFGILQRYWRSGLTLGGVKL